jgi:hypothetical protein
MSHFLTHTQRMHVGQALETDWVPGSRAKRTPNHHAQKTKKKNVFMIILLKNKRCQMSCCFDIQRKYVGSK